MSDANSPPGHPLARAVAPIAVLTLIWGCNWPILKIGVTELAPLTFRALTLPFAAIGLLTVAQLSGDSIRIPREWWSRVVALGLLNIAGWNLILRLIGSRRRCAVRHRQYLCVLHSGSFRVARDKRGLRTHQQDEYGGQRDEPGEQEANEVDHHSRDADEDANQHQR